MKRKIGIISTLLIIAIVIILAVLLTNKDDTKSINLDNGIAYYYEQEDGQYELGSSNGWSTGEYVLDIEDSSCNNEDNPTDIIDWDANSNEVLLIAKENISCTLYFDRMTDQEKFFEKLLGTSGNGELLYHNSLLANGAEDNGYRYSGDNPNNFICFGPGSESYNAGSSDKCEDGNLYRIIGYVPVQLENGKKEFRVKVIKSEYATADDLGKDSADGTKDFDEEYESLKRVKANDDIETFVWNDDYDNNIWGSSSLYKILNDSSSGYLHKLNDWEGKIENVQWNVEGSKKRSLPKAKEVYDEEWNTPGGAETKVSVKVGLMYISDYGFASSQDSWTSDLYDYADTGNKNCENNWLFNGVYEWTISRLSGDTDGVFVVYYSGYVNYDNFGDVYGVRPVFYLKSDVKLVNDNNIDGSMDHPFRLA